MSEIKYIGLDYEEAVNAKKQILASEIDLLNIIKSINSYRLLRKKELETKTKLKAAIYNLKTKISLAQSTFPEKEKTKIKQKEKHFKEEIKQKSEKIENKTDFQKELEEIQKKLSKLG